MYMFIYIAIINVKGEFYHYMYMYSLFCPKYYLVLRPFL